MRSKLTLRNRSIKQNWISIPGHNFSESVKGHVEVSQIFGECVGLVHYAYKYYRKVNILNQTPFCYANAD